MSQTYSSDSIKVLSDREHIQLRKEMYIGDAIDPRPIFSEIYDNAIDEVQAGFSSEMVISVDTKNNEYSIRDYGRGIPHGKKKLEDGQEKEILEVILTKSNSGGKFDKSSYLYSSGLHGLGVTVTNALSKSMTMVSYRKGKYVKAETFGTQDVKLSYGKSKETDGTLVVFQPDYRFFNNKAVPVEFIKDRCRVASALGFRARLIVDGTEIDTNATMFDLIREDRTEINTYVKIDPIEVESSTHEKMKVAMQYTSETNDRYFGYTNLLVNYLGGTHVQELAKCIAETWKLFVEKHKNIRPAIELHNSDYLVGLRAVCAVFISDPHFSSQTKEKLVVNKKYFDELMGLFSKQLYKYLDTNILIAQQLIKRFEEYRIAQNALLSRKEIGSLIQINTDSGDNIRRRSVVSKLVECTSKKKDGTELFLVEGNSACLRWNTLIRLANDTEATIKDVCERVAAGETIYVYGKPPKGRPNTGPNIYKVLGGGITRRKALLWRVFFDNGTFVDCTEDHKFMLKDRSFKEMRDLTPNDSLSIMTYHKDEFKPYHTHIYCDIYCKFYGISKIPKGHVVHHKDFNHYNNYPDNLELLTNSKHTTLHNQYNEQWKSHIGDVTAFKEYWSKEENHILASERAKKRFEKISEREKISLGTKIGMAKMTRSQHQKRLNLQSYNVSLAYYKDLIFYRKLFTIETIFNRELFKEQKRADGCIRAAGMYLYPEKFMAKYNIRTIAEFENLICEANHRITSIECLNIYEDVYDIVVDDVHNFCLANDIMVHNCGPYLFTRNKETQAILPLRGKILNVTFKTIKEAIQNSEVCDIANSIGAGIGSACDASKSRYSRIIISSDADEDGKHITSLLASLFVNLFPDLVKAGMVWIALPPLYCWGKDSKSFGWCNNINDIPKGVKDFHRFKGLGEMENIQLKYFCVDPNTRREMCLEYPSDIEEFNRIVGSSQGKNDLLKELGIIIEGDI